MTRISLNNPIAEDLQELFVAATDGRQPPLNLHVQMADSPAVIAAYVGIRRALEEHGSFDHRTRFALMLAVSAAQRCHYTQAVNTVLAARAGFAKAQIDAILTGGPIGDERLDALLAVAHEAATDSGHVTGKTWRAALDAGLSEQQLTEAYASIALAVFVDHFVNYADTPFDVPARPATAV